MCPVQDLLDLNNSRAVILHLLQGLHHYLNCSELITSSQRTAHLVKCVPWKTPQVFLAAPGVTQDGFGRGVVTGGSVLSTNSAWQGSCCAWQVFPCKYQAALHPTWKAGASHSQLSELLWASGHGETVSGWAEAVRSTFSLDKSLWCQQQRMLYFYLRSSQASGLLEVGVGPQVLVVSKNPQTLIPLTSSSLFVILIWREGLLAHVSLWVWKTFHTNLQTVSNGFVSPWLRDLSEKMFHKQAHGAPQAWPEPGRASSAALCCLPSSLSPRTWFHLKRWWKMWKKIHTARCKPLQSVSMPQGKKNQPPTGRSVVTWESANSVSSKLGVSFGGHREARVLSQGFSSRHAPWRWQHRDLGPSPNQASSFCKTSWKFEKVHNALHFDGTSSIQTPSRH